MSYNLQTKLVIKELSYSQKVCVHSVVEADKESRMLRCKDCKVWLDPFEFVWKWAMKQVVIEKVLAGLKEKEKEIWARIIELRKEEKRVKARLRNARAALIIAQETEK